MENEGEGVEMFLKNNNNQRKKRKKLTRQEAELLIPKQSRWIDSEAIEAVERCNNGMCECCNVSRTNCAHHISTRGAGGADIVQNLLGMCWVCHTLAHAANISLIRQKEIVSRRNQKLANNPRWHELLDRGVEAISKGKARGNRWVVT